MIWVGWRQQRAETLIAAAMLVLLAAVAIPVGLHMASVYSQQGLGACAGNVQRGHCDASVASFLVRFTGLNLLFMWSTLVPALVALLLAAPFVLDLDNGTYRLYWTQSITRRRWIATKLALGVVATVAVAGCLIALAMWLRAPLDHLNGRMSPNTYDAEGIVPVAYALFVLGVAVAIGAVWRRTVPALLVAFVVYVVGRAFMDSWLRQLLLSPVKTTWLASGSGPKLASGGGPNLNQALVINQFVSDKNGHRLADAVGPCATSSSNGLLTHTQHLCAQPHALGAHVYMTAIFQPASRFWELQGVEFGIVAGIGLLLVLVAAWWTHRRIA
jgi:phosphotransferase system  glucose/maltose/N-acetylglucosamine-specific IIC component